VPKNLLDWQGKPWDSSQGTKAAHPNSRFTVSIYNSPTLSDQFDNPEGVPISAVIFGGRRTQLIPLVVESFDWPHGVFLGARMGSETTAAAIHQVGVLRRDPMAMIPFCGYNMGDYFGHWLNIGERLSQPPKIFSVNWFRVDEDGKFIWPGYSENIRVLKWIVDRVHNRAGARQTPVGLIPNYKDLNLDGLNTPAEKLKKILEVDMQEWTTEIDDVKKFLTQFGKYLPEQIWEQCNTLSKYVG
jgi:phosphoenolpyruvate carboxykinase (GTP)